MAGAQSRTSCSSLFKQLQILPIPCQYILSLMMFIFNNQVIFQRNSSIRGLLEKYPTFGREKETGLPGALDT